MPSYRSLLLIWALAFALRCGVLVISWQGDGDWNTAPDSSRYLELAGSLSSGDGFRISTPDGRTHPELLTLPPYPLILASVNALAPRSALPILVFQCAMSALAAAVLLLAASKLAGRVAGTLAAVVFSIDAQSVAFSSMILTDSLSMTLVLLALAALLHYVERGSLRSAALCGIMLAAAAFMRPVNVILLVIGLIAIALVAISRRAWFRPSHLLVMLGLACLPVALWCGRNHAFTGIYFYTTSPDAVLVRWQLPRLYAQAHGITQTEARAQVGSALAIGDHLPLGLQPPVYRARARALAGELILDHPGVFARQYLAGLVRVAGQPDAYICRVLGYRTELAGLAYGNVGLAAALRHRWEELPWRLRLLYFGQVPYLGCLWLLALAGAWTGLRQGGSRVPAILLLAAIALYILGAGGFPGDPRYRAPAIPAIILLASLGLRRRGTSRRAMPIEEGSERQDGSAPGPHVVIFTEGFPEPRQVVGGLWISIRRQAEGLAERCRVTVVVFRRILPPLRRYEAGRILGRLGNDEEPRWSEGNSATRGLKVVRYSYLHIPILWPLTEPIQMMVLGLWALLRHARDADLLHGHCIYAMGVPAILLGKLTGRPSVSTAHGSDLYVHAQSKRRAIRWWVRLVLRNSTRVIAVSQNLMQTLASRGVGEERRRLVPNGVDTGRFRPVADLRPLRQRLGLPPDAHVFLSLNLFWPVKGHATLIEAFRRLSDRRPESFLVLAADGPLRGEVAAQVSRAGLDDRVRFTGLLVHEEVPDWIAAADALVMPSLNEGMPLAVLEGFASGKPLVATRVGGIPELVTDERYGILVPPNDPDAFADAMMESMSRAWDRDALRGRAEEFGWPRIVDRLIAIYREVVASRDSSLADE